MEAAQQKKVRDSMKKQDKDFDMAVKNALRGKEVPVLVLDSRWHSLFPKGDKPPEVVALEAQVNDLLKRQGRLVNELKELKLAKKKLMDGIVAGMTGSSDKDNRKKDNQQRLLLETKERIQQDSDELLGLPRQIKAANEALLIVGAKYCFERLSDGDKMLSELTTEITRLRAELNEKTDYKEELEESLDSAYSLMHSILGHDVMNLYDKGKLRK